MSNKVFKLLNITSLKQFILVNLVFALTGSLSLLVAGGFMEVIGLQRDEITTFAYWGIRIILVFFFYQCLLLAVSLPLGQFSYFSKMQKKMLRRIGIKI